MLLRHDMITAVESRQINLNQWSAKEGRRPQRTVSKSQYDWAKPLRCQQIACPEVRLGSVYDPSENHQFTIWPDTNVLLRFPSSREGVLRILMNVYIDEFWEITSLD